MLVCLGIMMTWVTKIIPSYSINMSEEHDHLDYALLVVYVVVDQQ